MIEIRVYFEFKEDISLSLFGFRKNGRGEGLNTVVKLKREERMKRIDKIINATRRGVYMFLESIFRICCVVFH